MLATLLAQRYGKGLANCSPQCVPIRQVLLSQVLSCLDWDSSGATHHCHSHPSQAERPSQNIHSWCSSLHAPCQSPVLVLRPGELQPQFLYHHKAHQVTTHWPQQWTFSSLTSFLKPLSSLSSFKPVRPSWPSLDSSCRRPSNIPPHLCLSS